MELRTKGDADAAGLVEQVLGASPEQMGRMHRAHILMQAAKKLLIVEREQNPPSGRHASIAITHVETAQLWVNEGMAGPGEGAL